MGDRGIKDQMTNCCGQDGRGEKGHNENGFGTKQLMTAPGVAPGETVGIRTRQVVVDGQA